LIKLLSEHPQLLDDPGAIERIQITIYEPAFSIIGDPHKRDPRTRQSADHSMVYIVATLVRKAAEAGGRESGAGGRGELWKGLMLMPEDYGEGALVHPVTRSMMERIDFRHGGPEYDAKYPDGIPTSLEIEHRTLGTFSSGLVMYPEGQARNASSHLPALLGHKFRRLAGLGVADVDGLYRRLTGLADKTPDEILDLYSFPIEHVRPA
jgi:2-methylcitrate dehydratase